MAIARTVVSLMDAKVGGSCAGVLFLALVESAHEVCRGGFVRVCLLVCLRLRDDVFLGGEELV